MTSTYAVADLGSNSARLLVASPGPAGHLDVIADARVSLRLVRHLDADGALRPSAIADAIATVDAFATVARHHGVRAPVVVATSAIRDAANRAEVLAAVRDGTGLTVRLLSGEDEARLAVAGAVAGLPVDDALVADLGGGSLELAICRGRRHTNGVSFPLGALRLSDLYLRHDPPPPAELTALRGVVLESLATDAGQPFREAMALVGTGGTVRALAKSVRALRAEPVTRLHGYLLRREDVSALVSRLSTLSTRERGEVRGISSTRAESILGGAVVIDALMEYTGSDHLMVSSHGVRQGVILESAGIEAPAVEAVRRGSAEALLQRLAGGTSGPSRRAALASLLPASLGVALTPVAVDLIRLAADLAEVGSRLDHYARWAEAAKLAVTADLDGFLHGELAAVAAMLVRASGAMPSGPMRRASCLLPEEVDRAAALLLLADDLDRRLAPGDVASLGAVDEAGVLPVSGLPVMPLPTPLTLRIARGCGRRVAAVGDAAGSWADGPEIQLEFK